MSDLYIGFNKSVKIKPGCADKILSLMDALELTCIDETWTTENVYPDYGLVNTPIAFDECVPKDGILYEAGSNNKESICRLLDYTVDHKFIDLGYDVDHVDMLFTVVAREGYESISNAALLLKVLVDNDWLDLDPLGYAVVDYSWYGTDDDETAFSGGAVMVSKYGTHWTPSSDAWAADLFKQLTTSTKQLKEYMECITPILA